MEVLEKSSNGWSRVRADLQWGWMPSVCLELDAGAAARLQPAAESTGLYVVVKASSQPPLLLGSLMTVTEVRDDGWWRVLSCAERVPAVCLHPLRPHLLDLLLRRKARASEAEQHASRSLDPSPHRLSVPTRSPDLTRRMAPPRPSHTPGESPCQATPPHSRATPPPSRGKNPRLPHSSCESSCRATPHRPRHGSGESSCRATPPRPRHSPGESPCQATPPHNRGGNPRLPHSSDESSCRATPPPVRNLLSAASYSQTLYS